MSDKPREIWVGEGKGLIIGLRIGTWYEEEMEGPPWSRYVLADQWIPVTERLPKKRTRAWTWDGHKARELVYLPWVSMWVDDAKRKYPDVTHWQPLPDPPEEE